MKRITIIIAGIVFLFTSCQQENFDQQKSQDHLIMSVLWYQKSAEMKALYYQCFNWAKMRVEMATKSNNDDVKMAVVVDIDETMLDNSPFETYCINNGTGYTKETWMKWTSMIKAKALPGAVEFSHFAKKHNVDVFYISNRSIDEFDVTLKNLQEQGFAFADSAHLHLRTTTSSKKERREKVLENYEIILLMGDNMGDFSEIFENRSENYGFDVVEENKEKFGDKFIVLPNPMYGAWEKPILDYNKNLTEEEKYNLRKSELVGY